MLAYVAATVAVNQQWVKTLLCSGQDWSQMTRQDWSQVTHDNETCIRAAYQTVKRSHLNAVQVYVLLGP